MLFSLNFLEEAFGRKGYKFNVRLPVDGFISMTPCWTGSDMAHITPPASIQVHLRIKTNHKRRHRNIVWGILTRYKYGTIFLFITKAKWKIYLMLSQQQYQFWTLLCSILKDIFKICLSLKFRSGFLKLVKAGLDFVLMGLFSCFYLMILLLLEFMLSSQM